MRLFLLFDFEKKEGEGTYLWTLYQFIFAGFLPLPLSLSRTHTQALKKITFYINEVELSFI